MEGTIQQLFEGHNMNYIECINVDYKSTRKESFYGIYIWPTFKCAGLQCLCRILNVDISWQISSLMSKVVGMFMLLLTSMWKLNDLRVITNTMLKNMVCRLVTACD